MVQQKAYQCANCKTEVLTKDDEKTPACCDNPMQSIPLEQCTLAPTAEHSRLDQGDEPCDDGRSGK